jgi:pimeloyl-ACP methyl ester carboxylesterase
VIAVAAGDPEVAAVVSQAPFTDGLTALRANTPATSARFTVAGIRDAVSALRRRAPHYIPAVGAPGTLAVMTAAEAEPGFRALDPPGSTWVNRVAARVMLTVGAYRPYAKFGRLRMPVLVQTCDEDATTPAAPAVQAAESSPNAELIRYPIGHFEIYVDPQFERTIADQTEFLTRNLLPTPVAPTARPADPRVPARGSP